MKNKKSLNKLLSGIGMIGAVMVLLYGFCVMIQLSTGDPAHFWEGEINWSAAGIILAFASLTALLVIIKMIAVTGPALRGKTDKMMARAALIMDIITLLGFILVCLMFVFWVVLPKIAFEDPTLREHLGYALTSGFVVGYPLIFIGNLLSGSFARSALKTGK